MAGLVRRGARGEARGAGADALDTTTSIDFMAEAISSEQPDIAVHAAARRPGDDPLLRHRGLDPDHRAARRRALARGPARPQLALSAPASRPRGIRGQEPGRRVHARLPRRAPGARVRGGDPARAGRDRSGRGRARAGADRHARGRGDPRGGRLLRPQRDPRRPDRGRGPRRRDPRLASSSRSAPKQPRRSPVRSASTRGRELELKGLAGTHRVYRAEWEQALAA